MPDLPDQSRKRPVSAMQRLFDNPWLLLLLGVVVPVLSYTAWGWIGLATLTKATLP